VLLLVLVAIVVVGVAMTTSAKRSLQMSLSAIESSRAIQRRWGMYSCQRTLLPAASGLFDVSDRTTRKQRGRKIPFPAVLSDRLILGGQTLDLIVSDEDAKANLNAIYDIGGKRVCEKALTSLAGAIESRTVQLIPNRASVASPTAKNSAAGESTLSGNKESTLPNIDFFPAFRSWGEVFDLVSLSRISGDDRQIAKMTRRITLFGTGRLNVFRAADETVLAVSKAAIQDGLAQRVLSKIRETSLSQIDLILEQTVTNEDDRQELKLLLSESSNSFSIWIEISDRSSRQQRFAVQSPDNFGKIRTAEFSFE